MRRPTNPPTLWLTLVVVSGIPRVLGAFLLPNAFGDAYVYIHDLSALSAKISAGTFVSTDLFGFWLPLYQFICALVNVFAGNGFYVGKLVSAVFGIGVCLFVYGITLRLTAYRTAALLAFALIAFNPLHIFYSASAMTDVPHAFFVLAGLYFALKRRWVIAAAFAALAGLTRMESWMFILLLPLIQFLKERRVSPAAFLILLIPPLFWFYISWRATGNWLSCFDQRRQYHDWLLAANPSLAHFSLTRILRDGAVLLVSTDLAVMLGGLVAGWFGFERLVRAAPPERISKDPRAIIPGVILFFAFLSLIVVAYLSGTQPIIFPRYGLILFSLGIPILAWTYLALTQRHPYCARRLLIAVVAICVFDASVQLVGSVGSLNQISAQRAIADYLHTHFQAGGESRIFCDEGTVQALSGIPPEKFLTSSGAPRDAERFLAYLKEKNVGYLVFVDKEDSTPAKLFPELKSGKGNMMFEPVMHSSSRFLSIDVWVYRVESLEGNEHTRRHGGSSPTVREGVSAALGSKQIPLITPKA
jgi:hypothetical protein